MAARGHRADRVPALAALGVVVLAVLAACVPGGPSTSPASSAASPSAGTSSPGPKPTNWPTGVIEAAIALGVADTDFAKIGADLEAAIAAGDLEALLSVVTNVIEFLEGNAVNIPRLRGYPATETLGNGLAPAYATMLEGATTIRDALLAGDADGVEAGFARFAEGTVAYSQLRQQVNEAATQALFMKRHLVR